MREAASIQMPSFLLISGAIARTALEASCVLPGPAAHVAFHDFLLLKCHFRALAKEKSKTHVLKYGWEGTNVEVCL